MNNIFYDVQTGAPIPQATIMASLQRLDNIQIKLQESSKIYKQVIKSCPPHMDHEEKKKIAKKRADQYLGARLLDIWDGLADDKVIITMVVTAPPAKDQKEAADNEDRLRCAIFQVDQYLHEQMVDLWTSREEIGGLHETYIYVRWPYHFGCQVKALAVCLSQLEGNETHKFIALRAGTSCQDTSIQLFSHGCSQSMARSFQL